MLRCYAVSGDNDLDVMALEVVVQLSVPNNDDDEFIVITLPTNSHSGFESNVLCFNPWELYIRGY